MAYSYIDKKYTIDRGCEWLSEIGYLEYLALLHRNGIEGIYKFETNTHDVCVYGLLRGRALDNKSWNRALES